MSKPKRTRIASQPQSAQPTPADPATLPARYILITQGACLEPDIPSGSKVLIERDGEIGAGDLAVLYFKPEHVQPGRSNSILKRVVLPPPAHVKFPWREHPETEAHAVVIVETTNPPRELIFKCKDLLAIHKCGGLVPLA
jgi:hypothetical protein